MDDFLEVISPGAHTTVQDLGRFGYLSVGVPPSGALDPLALRLANCLVKNHEGTACLEILYAGPEMIVHKDTLRLALAGQGCGIQMIAPDTAFYPAGRSVTLKRNARFKIAPLKGASCAYLAIEGGLKLEPCMGSFSTYTRGGFGGFHGRSLLPGDRLPLSGNKNQSGPELCISYQKETDTPSSLSVRVVMGPQDDHFTQKGIETFLNTPFFVSSKSDRMGARLDGATLELDHFENFVSDGISAGAIQVPGSGQPIILLKDHQTSGGYPKIATVISADLPALGRARIGHKIHFVSVDVQTAEKARREQETDFKKRLRTIQPLDAEPHVNLDVLYSGNLVSGFVDGWSNEPS